MDYVKLRQCKLGELRWVATVLRPDICARLARIASRINAPCGIGVYRKNELVRVVKNWQQASGQEFAQCIAPPSAEGAGAERRGTGEPAEKGRKDALRLNDLSGMVGCCSWGPAGGRQVPIRLRDRLDIVDFEGSMSPFALNTQIYQENGAEKYGWRS